MNAPRNFDDLNAVLVAQNWRGFVVDQGNPTWKIVSLQANAAGLAHVDVNFTMIRLPAHDFHRLVLRLNNDSRRVRKIVRIG